MLATAHTLAAGIRLHDYVMPMELIATWWCGCYNEQKQFFKKSQLDECKENRLCWWLLGIIAKNAVTIKESSISLATTSEGLTMRDGHGHQTVLANLSEDSGWLLLPEFQAKKIQAIGQIPTNKFPYLTGDLFLLPHGGTHCTCINIGRKGYLFSRTGTSNSQ